MSWRSRALDGEVEAFVELNKNFLDPSNSILTESEMKIICDEFIRTIKYPNVYTFYSFKGDDRRMKIRYQEYLTVEDLIVHLGNLFLIDKRDFVLTLIYRYKGLIVVRLEL